MTILGFDPGIGRTGWGVIEKNSNNHTVVSYGCIETPSTAHMNTRLVSLFAEASDLIKTYNPELIALEELFFNTNAKTALTVGQARGVIILACAQKDIPTTSYTPLQVKMALAGYGRADKKQVAQMVKSLLKLKTIPKPDDVTDALAVALTGGFSYKLQKHTSVQ